MELASENTLFSASITPNKKSVCLLMNTYTLSTSINQTDYKK